MWSPLTRTIPWLQDIDANQNGVSDIWYDQWQVTYRDVWVVDANNELVSAYNLTSNDLANEANYNTLRQMIIDVAVAGRTPASPWQNEVEPYDVSLDGFVTPTDALRIINRLNSEGAGELPVPSDPVSSYVDVTGDNFVSSVDALRVIRHLNRFSLGGEGEPESTSQVAAGYATVEAGDTSTANSVPDSSAATMVAERESAAHVLPPPVVSAEAVERLFAESDDESDAETLEFSL